MICEWILIWYHYFQLYGLIIDIINTWLKELICKVSNIRYIDALVFDDHQNTIIIIK